MVLEEAGLPGTQLVVDQAAWLDNEKVITGAHAGGGILVLIDQFRAETFELDTLVNHQLSLEEGNAGFDLMTRGEARRSMIVFGA